ncbi:MAG: hypothetical protein AMXMBFR53_08200 [Gemmatimonadota bacterium]
MWREETSAVETAHGFCRDVLAGHPPPLLPAGATERAETVRLLGAHRLLGLWRAESGARADEALEPLLVLQALKGALMLEAAERAGSALREAGFQVLLFKGAGLIRSGVYPDSRARAMDDADLLVRGGDPESAIRVLQGVGFAPWVAWRPGRDAWLPAFTFSDATAPAELEVTVDLHWRIPYGSLRSGDEDDAAFLWARADADLGVPSAEAHALLVAEHFVRHLRVVPHLLGIADLVRLVPRLHDAPRLRALAEERRSLRLIQSLLWFLRSELGVTLPDPLAEALAVPRSVGRLRAGVLRVDRLLDVPGGRRRARLSGLVGQALFEGSPADVARQAWRVLHPPAEWLARRAGPDGGGGLRRRLGYSWELLRWAAGRGASPLSPNQEFEGPTGRQ